MSKKFTEALKKIIKSEFIEGFIDDNGVRVYASIEALAKQQGNDLQIFKSTKRRLAEIKK
jgi:hypothetical protein